MIRCIEFPSYVCLYVWKHYAILIKLENISDEMKIICRLFR